MFEIWIIELLSTPSSEYIREKINNYRNHNCLFCSRVFHKNTLSNRFGLAIFFIRRQDFFSFALLRQTNLQSRSKEIQQDVSLYNRASQFQTEKVVFFAFWFYCYLYI